ncbi:MAG TPA: DUF2000 domain-containing protein [Alphaproteobacteria bacterium]|nr:DUF2000 domain-containing protein [Alphaproteobacteria bacterium]
MSGALSRNGVEAPPRIRFENKIAVVLREDLAVWQKLNATAFLVSGVAARTPGVIGEPYEDGTGNRYLPMFRQPVLVFAGTAEQVRSAYERALARGVAFSLFTEELFTTGNDADNRAAVRACPSEALRVVGIAFHAERKLADKLLKGMALHR